MEELLVDSRFVESFNKIVPLKNNFSTSLGARSAMEENYNFTIDNKPAQVIEMNGKISYTFAILRDNNSLDSFENLIVQIDSLQITTAVIIKYSITSDITENSHGSYLFESNKEITPIIYDNTTVSGAKEHIVCNEINYISCCQSSSGGWGSCHHASEFCLTTNAGTTFLFANSEIVCSSSGGGGDGGLGPLDGGNPSGNTGPTTGGGGGTTTGPINTNPNLPEFFDEEAAREKECEKIRKLFNDYPSYKQALLVLAGKVNQQVENGLSIDISSSTIKSIVGVAGRIDFSNNPMYSYISIAHTHDASGTYSVFSWDDLALMARAVENGKIKTDKFVAFLITAKGTRYALTIRDASKLTNFLYQPSAVQGTPVDVPRMMNVNKVYNDYYGNNTAIIKPNNSDNVKVQKAFLQMLRDNDAGVEIFQIDATFENFAKLKLEANNTDVTPTNCN